MARTHFRAKIGLALAVATLIGSAALTASQLAVPPVQKVANTEELLTGSDPETFVAPPTPLLQAIDEQILTLAFSPDGAKLVTAGARYQLPGQIKMWEVATGKELFKLRGISGVRSLAFAPDGQTFATGDFGGNIKLRDANTGNERAAVKGHTVGVNGVAFTTDGALVISAGLDKIVKVWDTKGLQLHKTLTGHTDMVNAVACFREGSRIVTGARDMTARIWDVKTGEEKAVLKGHTGWVEVVAVSPDDKTIVTGSWDGTIKLWNAETGQEVGVLQEKGYAVFSLAYSRDGDRIVSAGPEGVITVWDVKERKRIKMLEQHVGAIWGLAYSRDGKHLASGSSDCTAKLWDVADGKELRGFDAAEQRPIQGLAYAPDGRAVAVATLEKTARLHDAKTGAVLQVVSGHSDLVTCVAFTPGGDAYATGSIDKSVKIWDRATGQEKLSLNAQTEVRALAFSKDGKIAAAGDDHKVRVWDAASGKELNTFTGHEDVVHALAFAADTATLASGSADRTIKLWPVAKEAEPLTLQGHIQAVRALAFAPDGLLASAGDDATVRLWREGKARAAIGGHGNPVWSLAFSPRGRTLVSGGADGAMIVWDAATGQRRGLLRGHKLGVTALAMHPQGEHVLSASRDANLLRWEAGEANTPSLTLRGHPQGAWFAAYSSANDLLATGGAGGAVTLWTRTLAPAKYPFTSQPGAYWDAAYAPDGTLAVAMDKNVRILDRAGRILRVFPMKKIIRSVSFSPDAKYLAATTGHWKTPKAPEECTIWDIAAGKEVVTLEGHKGTIYVARFSPDGKTVATTSIDRGILIWELPSGKLRGALKGHNEAAKSMVFLPDGTLVTASWDKTIRFWDVDKLEKIRVWTTDLSMASLAVSPDGRLLAAAEEPMPAGIKEDFRPAPLKVWEVSTGKEYVKLQGHQGRILGLAFTPDSRGLLAGGGKLSAYGEAMYWDLATGAFRASRSKFPQWLENVAVSPDGKIVAGPVNGSLDLWNLDFLHKERTWSAHGGGVVGCGVFVPGGKVLATGGLDGAVKLWDVAKGELITSLDGHKERIRALAISPDGKTLVSASEDTTALIWDLGTHKQKATLRGSHDRGMYSVAISPDGKTIATGGGVRAQPIPGELIFWDLDTAKQRRAPMDVERVIWSLAYSPDGKLVAAGIGDGSLKVWDADTGEQKAVWPLAQARAVAFSPGGDLVAIGSGRGPTMTAAGQGRVHLWDVHASQEMGEVHGHRDVVFQVTFAPDGQTVASASQDGTVKLSPIPRPEGKVFVALPRLPKVASSTDASKVASEAAPPKIAPGVQLVDMAKRSPVLQGSRLWWALAIVCAVALGSGWGLFRLTRLRRQNAMRAIVPSTNGKPFETGAAPVFFACPRCGKNLKARPELVGRNVKCPQCGSAAPVPSVG